MINNILEVIKHLLILVLSGGISYLISRQIYKLFPEFDNSTGAIAEAIINFIIIAVVFLIIMVVLAAVILTIF